MSLSEAFWAGGSKTKPRAGCGRTRRQTALVLIAIASFTPLLAACGGGGFKPLYGSSAVGGTEVDEQLKSVDIAPIPGRVGQRIRNELIFKTTGGSGSERAQSKYRLEIAIRERLSSSLVRRDGDSRGRIYKIDASYQLIRLSDKQVVAKGKSFAQANFERFKSIFANERAVLDAQNRTARTISEDVKVRLSAYLASQA